MSDDLNTFGQSLRTTVVGSWPVSPQFDDRMKDFHAGRLSEEMRESLLEEVARTAIEQQIACGLDEFTGGETWADSFILHFPKLLSGIEPTKDADAWEGRGTYRATGPLAAPNGLGVSSAYRRESAIAPGISKVNLPGPSEITMMILPMGEREALEADAVRLIRAEMEACISAGACEVQIDLPHVSMGLVDGRRETDEAVGMISSLFAGFGGIRRSIHFCYGDFGAKTWTQNRSFQPLLATLQGLAGVIDRVVIEFSLPEQWEDRALLAEIPAPMEIAAGIVDVKSPAIESVDTLRTKIQDLLAHVPAERLLICPSCGFGRRDVPMAFAKTKNMVEAVRQMRAT